MPVKKEIERINPIDLKNDTAIGLKIPLASSDTSFFGLNYTTLDQAKTNLKNLLLTEKGERYMMPDFGCNLKHVLFQQITEDTDFEVRTTVEESINAWLPYIKIDDLAVYINKRNEHQINIRISFSLKYNPTVKENLDLVIYN